MSDNAGYTFATPNTVTFLSCILCAEVWLYAEKRDKNMSVFVRSMCITQRNIVSNIFKCISIMCICSVKYRKNLQRQIHKDCVFDLTNALPKIEIICSCY